MRQEECCSREQQIVLLCTLTLDHILYTSHRGVMMSSPISCHECGPQPHQSMFLVATALHRVQDLLTTCQQRIIGGDHPSDADHTRRANAGRFHKARIQELGGVLDAFRGLCDQVHHAHHRLENRAGQSAAHALEEADATTRRCALDRLIDQAGQAIGDAGSEVAHTIHETLTGVLGLVECGSFASSSPVVVRAQLHGQLAHSAGELTSCAEDTVHTILDQTGGAAT
mmetsp:Transcript_51376/g.128920  ORF Transcript_51376/g.128920 Transcript_51376/m.128920 type:complete len:227 (-) Transcript_51376:2036-2716(-)